MATKKAKITKLREDQLLKNGSKETVFPVTLGEAVQVKENPDSNRRKTLADTLNSINSSMSSLNTSVTSLTNRITTAERIIELQNVDIQALKEGKVGYLWYTYKEVEDKTYYEILGFTDVVSYGNWASVYNRTSDPDQRAAADDKYIIARTISGEVAPSEDPVTPPDPPVVEIPRLITPENGGHYEITKDDSNYTADKIEGHFNLSGEYLKQNVTIYSANSDFKFAVRSTDSMTHLSRLTFDTNNTNLSLINREGGVDISVIPYDANANTENRVWIESNEFEPINLLFTYVKVEEGVPTVVSPIEGTVLELNNIKGTIQDFNFKMKNAPDYIVIDKTATSEALQSYFSLSKDGRLWSDKIFLNQGELESGVKIYVTCRPYSGGVALAPPTEDCSFSLHAKEINILTTDPLSGLPLTYEFVEDGFSQIVVGVNYTYISSGTPVVDSYLRGKDVTEIIVSSAVLNDQYFTLEYRNLPENEPILIQFDGWGNNNNAQGVNWGEAFDVYIKYPGDLNWSKRSEYKFVPLSEKNTVYVTFKVKKGVTQNIPSDVEEVRGNVKFQCDKYQVTGTIIWRNVNYTPSEEETTSLVIKREDNPTLVDQLYLLSISSKENRNYVGAIASNQGLTQSEIDSVIGFPVDFFRNILQSADKVPFDSLDLSLFRNLINIRESALADCYNLVTVILPPNLTTLGGAVFGGDVSLKALAIPDSVTKLPNSLCAGCTNLETIDLGQNITHVTSGFEDCENLNTIILRCPEGVFLDTKMQLGADNQIGFSKKIQINGENNDNLKIYVPAELLTGYQEGNGNWATYFGSDVFDTIDNLSSN
jgi:hypothetical protein